MTFDEVARDSRSFFSHPAADNARGRGGFLGVDTNMEIYHVPYTVRGDTPVWGNFKPVLPLPIARITGAPFDPVFVLENGTEIRCTTDVPDGFSAGDAGLSLVYKIPVAALPAPRADGKIELKRLEVTGNLSMNLQGELTAQEIADKAIRADDVLYSIAAYTAHRNNGNYADGTKTLAETGKALQLRTPEVVWLSQGGLEIGRAFLRWEIQREDNRVFIVKVMDPLTVPIPEGSVYAETAATLGYTSIGSAGHNDANHLFFSGGYQISEDGVIDTLHFAFNNVDTLAAHRLSVYTGATPTDLSYDNTTLLPDRVGTGAGWAEWDTPSNPSMANGVYYSIAAAAISGHSLFYDTSGGGGFWDQSGVPLNSAPPDPASPALLIANWAISGYFTYSVAAPSGGLRPRANLSGGMQTLSGGMIE